MPPDEPAPRLMDVAASFAANKMIRSAGGSRPPADRLNGRIADAFHEIVAGADQKRVDQHADNQHADKVAQIGIANAVEDIFGEAQAADECGRRNSDQGTEQSIKQKRIERGR